MEKGQSMSKAGSQMVSKAKIPAKCRTTRQASGCGGEPFQHLPPGPSHDRSILMGLWILDPVCDEHTTRPFLNMSLWSIVLDMKKPVSGHINGWTLNQESLSQANSVYGLN